MKKNILHTIIIGLAIIINIACHYTTDKSNDTIAQSNNNHSVPNEKLADSEVVICNLTNTMKGLYYHDQLGFGKPITLAAKDTFKINLNEPTYLINSGKYQHFIKVIPNDTVYIYEEGEKVYFNSPRNLLINKCLDDWFKNGDAVRYAYLNPWNKIKFTMLERDKKITSLYQERLVKAKRYAFNEADRQEIEQILTGTLINDKMLLYTTGYSMDKVRQYYRDSVEAWGQKLSTLAEGKHYLPTQFMNGAVAVLFIYQENSPLNKVIPFIETHFSYQLRDFLIANRINIKLQENEKETVDLNKMLGNTNISSYYMAKLQTKLEERNSFLANLSIKTDKTILTNRQGQVYNLDSLLSSRKNRLLYIDCWASWCMPCLAEMKHSQALQELYKDKAIDFVYLSMDKDKKAWLIAEKNLKLMNESNSFLVLDHFNSAFVKKHRINSIPRYMLLAADGKPISLDAPRPSDPKLKALINKYIQ